MIFVFTTARKEILKTAMNCFATDYSLSCYCRSTSSYKANAAKVKVVSYGVEKMNLPSYVEDIYNNLLWLTAVVDNFSSKTLVLRIWR